MDPYRVQYSIRQDVFGIVLTWTITTTKDDIRTQRPTIRAEVLLL